ncbi:DUF3810 domain-containing protein [Sinomicrobium sp.]
MSEKAKNLLALSIVPQALLIRILAGFPDVVESYYSNGVYRFIASAYRYAFGWIPFSVGDIFYALAAIALLRFLWLNTRSVRQRPWMFFREILLTLSLVHLLFYLSWGLNYYRLPLHRNLKIEAEYTTEELISFTEKLIKRTNTLHSALATSDSSAVQLPYSRKEIYQKSAEGYAQLSKENPHLSYSPTSIKSSLFSLPLSYMGYGGYLNPFTNEAQVNSMQVDYRYPIVSCHEEAHQIGYSAENEANFIGYLAATANPDPYFQYSGYAYMLRYCLNEVYRRDREKYTYLTNSLYQGVFENYKETSLFWKKYENPLEPIFKNAFNIYLKANKQTDGIKTYSYVVALLVNYHKNKPL